jgi:hypothetical protein
LGNEAGDHILRQNRLIDQTAARLIEASGSEADQK